MVLLNKLRPNEHNDNETFKKKLYLAGMEIENFVINLISSSILKNVFNSKPQRCNEICFN